MLQSLHGLTVVSGVANLARLDIDEPLEHEASVVEYALDAFDGAFDIFGRQLAVRTFDHPRDEFELTQQCRHLVSHENSVLVACYHDVSGISSLGNDRPSADQSAKPAARGTSRSSP